MQVDGKVVVVTGGGGGIGRALCERFAAERAHAVVVADRTLEQFWRIDLFCSNAGICLTGGPDAPDADWQRIWEVNLMSHVYAARAVLPSMLARKEGYLLQTASAAGLLTQIGGAPYAVTKHAAVGFAEWLAITYGSSGIKVSCLCPQGVQTDMLDRSTGGLADHLRQSALSAEDVADAVIAGLASENFLILPHPEVADYFLHKAQDYDRWIRGLRRLQEQCGANP